MGQRDVSSLTKAFNSCSSKTHGYSELALIQASEWLMADRREVSILEWSNLHLRLWMQVSLRGKQFDVRSYPLAACELRSADTRKPDVNNITSEGLSVAMLT